MNRRYKRRKKSHKIREIILTHIENNIKNYVIVSILFLVGVVIGVIFINNTSESQSSEIINYITSFSKDLKENQNINNLLLLKDSIKKNIVLTIILWFMGSTVIGISVVYLTICFRGFCLGYTISSIVVSLGIRKRNIILISSTAISNFDFCTMYISTCCKWYETS